MTTIDIIKQITSEKERQKRHPTHALFNEVLKVAETLYPISAKEIVETDIADLEKQGIVETGQTLNDIYIRLI